MHLNLNNTTIGLRYQLGDLNFLDPSIFLYYKNALTSHPRYRAIHTFLHKPIIEFDSVKLFMSRCSLMYAILNTLYAEDYVNFQDFFNTSHNLVNNLFGVNSFISSLLPTSLFYR